MGYDVAENAFFSTLGDEASDMNQTELLSSFISIVKSGTFRKEFLCFVSVSSLTNKNLTTVTLLEFR